MPKRHVAGSPTGVLCGADIVDLLNHETLAIVPLIAGQVDPGEASVDLHVGHYFLMPRRPEMAVLAPRDACCPAGRALEPEEVALEPVWVPPGAHIYLHPREFLLAATLEYIALPPNLCAEVMGRSRWARVGLVVQMASFVHPGYHGCLTLEMQNLGSAPVKLEPYLRVAHLAVMPSTSAATEPPSGQITCAIKPEFWPLVSPRERELLDRLAPRPLSDLDRIVADPGTMGGQPCIRGTRVSVRRIVCLVAEGQDTAALQDRYPELTKEDIQQALAYAGRALATD